MSESLAIIVSEAERRKVRKGREDIAPFVEAATKECEAIAQSQARKHAEARPDEGERSADFSHACEAVF